MLSGRNAGELGLYGFRQRIPGTSRLRIASSRDVRFKRIWERVEERGGKAATLFVPLTAPPSPSAGTMVAGMLHADGPATYPPSLEAELQQRFGPLIVDVADFRDGDLDRIFDELEAMRDQHFEIAKTIWREQKPELLTMVELGTDRLHHAAWHRIDPEHPRYIEGHPHEQRALDYYKGIDAHIGELLADTSDDDYVFVVSDHGAKTMQSGFAVNELLRREGWLHFCREPEGVEPLRNVIDWSRTKAWAEGGYYARVFLNVAGRDENGVLAPAAIEASRRELAQLFERAVPGTKAYWPEHSFGVARGAAPALLVVLDNLHIRAIGTVGHGEGDALRVPGDRHDGCNHDWNGIYLLAGHGIAPGREDAEIFDIHASLMDILNLSGDPALHGRSLRMPRSGR